MDDVLLFAFFSFGFANRQYNGDPKIGHTSSLLVVAAVGKLLALFTCETEEDAMYNSGLSGNKTAC